MHYSLLLFDSLRLNIKEYQFIISIPRLQPYNISISNINLFHFTVTPHLSYAQDENS